MLRGALIGMAELVPGISGGTVALVVGVSATARHGLAHRRRDALGGAGQGSFRRTRAAFRHADWWLLGTLALGMLAMVFTMAGVLGDFVTDHPEVSSGLFLGMVAASIYVPLTMARQTPGGRTWVLALLLVAGAVLAFTLTSLPRGDIGDPSYLLVFVAAAVAICALVLPGMSGSFLLMAMGLYVPTMAAVSDRNISYIAVFVAGAFVGIALFVKVLDRLLEDFRKPTLIVMVGLMIGSLRALWPWRDDEVGDVFGPGDNWPAVVAAAVGGAIIVSIASSPSTRSRRVAAAKAAPSASSERLIAHVRTGIHRLAPLHRDGPRGRGGKSLSSSSSSLAACSSPTCGSPSPRSNPWWVRPPWGVPVGTRTPAGSGASPTAARTTV